MIAANIPPKLDKWIVFILALVAAAFRGIHNTGIGLGRIPSTAISLLIAGIFTLLYLAWCALCGWIARRIWKDADSGHVRLFANVTYGAFLVISVLPLFNFTVTVDLPH